MYSTIMKSRRPTDFLKLVPKTFHNSPAFCSKKTLILNPYSTGTSLRKCVKLLDQTVIPHYLSVHLNIFNSWKNTNLSSEVNFTKIKKVKSQKTAL